MKESVKNFIDHVRKYLLSESDWTQLPDSPLSLEKKQQWANYRQTLRDMPQVQNPNTEYEVIWPSKPE